MTREEAIDLLDNLIGFVEDNHGSDYDKALKIAIKALEQEPRWIPVSERLPEKNRAVLTYVDTGASKTYCLAYWKGEGWEEWIGYRMVESEMGYKVLAWMPLPEPYKAESEVKPNE